MLLTVDYWITRSFIFLHNARGVGRTRQNEKYGSSIVNVDNTSEQDPQKQKKDFYSNSPDRMWLETEC